eukprot:3764442-Pyramimonas_sp.AAC.1
MRKISAGGLRRTWRAWRTWLHLAHLDAHGCTPPSCGTDPGVCATRIWVECPGDQCLDAPLRLLR